MSMATNQSTDPAAAGTPSDQGSLEPPVAEPVEVPEAEATANACLLAWKIEAAFEERGPDPRVRLIVLCGAEVPAWRAAAQLGAAYAALGWNTVVVDDRCPAEPADGIPSDQGLLGIPDGATAGGKSVVPTSKPRLSVARRQAAPVLAQVRSAREFIKSVASHFERVVVATGVPQAAVAVAPALALEAAAVVIVVRPGRTRRQTVTTALTALRELGAPVVGIVLSDE